MAVKQASLIGVRVLTGTLLLGLAAAGEAQAQEVRDEWVEGCAPARNGRGTVCRELRESTVAATGSFTVDARPNGGISVRSWDGSEVRVRARLQTSAREEARAREIASSVQVRTEPGRASSSGPRVERNEGWSVSYEVLVPRQTNLTLGTVNGGLRVDDVSGDIEVTTTNGGINLSGVSGAVRGSSTNGGITVQLVGRTWDGAGLDLRTTNGGVSVSLPEGYAANLDASTVNGSVDSQIPLTVHGRIGRSVRAEIGGGGPPVRLRTTNGGIKIRRG